MTSKSRSIRKRIFVLGFLFQILCMSAAVHADNCPDDISNLPPHSCFLKGAVLAELSYKMPGRYHGEVSYRCPSQDTQFYDVFGGQPVLLHDIARDIYSHAKGCVEGTQRSGCVKEMDEGNGRAITKKMISRRVGGRRFREAHYRCTDSNADVNNLTMTIQWTRAQDELSLLIRMGVVVGEAIEYTEDLRLVQLNSDDRDEQEWVGIAGTNPFSSESFLTTIRALQGQSCLFDFALETAALFLQKEMRKPPTTVQFPWRYSRPLSGRNGLRIHR